MGTDWYAESTLDVMFVVNRFEWLKFSLNFVDIEHLRHNELFQSYCHTKQMSRKLLRVMKKLINNPESTCPCPHIRHNGL